MLVTAHVPTPKEVYRHVGKTHHSTRTIASPPAQEPRTETPRAYVTLRQVGNQTVGADAFAVKPIARGH